MQQNKRPKLIGITGTIGSGKTTVASIISYSHTVYQTDDLVHKILNDEQVISKSKSLFGNILDEKGKIDRNQLADIVFNNSDELLKLNNLLHPIVLQILQELVDKSDEEYLFIEVPLLFEVNLQYCFDYIVLVLTDEVIAIDRLIRDRTLDLFQIRSRLNHQINAENKIKLSDYIIENNRSLDELSKQVKKMLQKIQQIDYRDIIPFNEVNINK